MIYRRNTLPSRDLRLTAVQTQAGTSDWLHLLKAVTHAQRFRTVLLSCGEAKQLSHHVRPTRAIRDELHATQVQLAIFVAARRTST